MLAAAFFFAGVRFERERRRLEDEAAQQAARKALKFFQGALERVSKGWPIPDRREMTNPQGACAKVGFGITTRTRARMRFLEKDHLRVTRQRYFLWA